jgi:hypothetical protein
MGIRLDFSAAERHSDPGDNPGRADRTRPDPDLHSICSSPSQSQRAFGRTDVARDQLQLRVLTPQLPRRINHLILVAVRRIDDNGVDLGIDQRLGPRHRVASHADRGRNLEPTLAIKSRVRILDPLQNVLGRNQAPEPPAAVYYRQLLDTVLAEYLACAPERRALGRGNKAIGGHHLRHRQLPVVLEQQIALGQYAYKPHLRVNDRQPGNPVLRHQLARLGNRLVRGYGYRLGNHARLGPLHSGDHGRLLLNRQILVNDPDAAGLGHSNRHPRLGHGVHGRADQRKLQQYPPREVRLGIDLVRKHARLLRNQENVIESQGFLDAH